VIEPHGAESPRKAPEAGRRSPGPGGLIALLVIAALLSGAVAAGVTLAVLKIQARTNPQVVDLGGKVTVQEENAAVSVAATALPAVTSILSKGDDSPHGSGFLVTSDGFVVTTVGVVAGARGLSVLIGHESKRRDARLVDYDCRTGVAVVKVDGVANLPTLAFGDSAALKAGQNVFVVGGSLGDRPGLRRGVISALHQEVAVDVPPGGGGPGQLDDVIETDVAIGASNTGGPLLDVSGRVVGLATGGPDRLGLAIGSASVQPEAQQIVQNGQLVLPALGVTTTTVTADRAAVTGGVPGARITGLDVAGVADRAGLKVGDVITQLDEEKLDDSHPLLQVLASRFRPAQKVTVSYNRGGNGEQVQLALGTQKGGCS